MVFGVRFAEDSVIEWKGSNVCFPQVTKSSHHGDKRRTEKEGQDSKEREQELGGECFSGSSCISCMWWLRPLSPAEGTVRATAHRPSAPWVGKGGLILWCNDLLLLTGSLSCWPCLFPGYKNKLFIHKLCVIVEIGRERVLKGLFTPKWQFRHHVMRNMSSLKHKWGYFDQITERNPKLLNFKTKWEREKNNYKSNFSEEKWWLY